jgi:hypothetical protein
MLAAFAALGAALGVALTGCASDNGTNPDTVPPAAVRDLTSTTVTDTSITITWTAPGDDGTRGRAARYDIRITTTGMITGENEWRAAQSLSGVPGPAPAGARESFTIRGLHPGWSYYCALETADEASNWSPLSNPHGMATSDRTPPARIDDLWAESRGSAGVLLRWTSPQDNRQSGRASLYTVRESLDEITEENWGSATTIPDPATPARAGDPESLLVGGLDPETIYHFAIRSQDADGNDSPVSNDIPIETIYGARTAPANLIANLRLAWIHRDYFEYVRLFDPTFVFVFDPQDVGGPHGIPTSWSLAEEATSSARLFGGQPNADGYRALDVQLAFDAGAMRDSSGVLLVGLANVSLDLLTRSGDGSASLDYIVENGGATLEIVQTTEIDPASGLPTFTITRWKDRTIASRLSQSVSWGLLKALWR